MVRLRWGVGAVGAGCVPGGAAGGARFGILRLSKGRVLSLLWCGVSFGIFLAGLNARFHKAT